MTARTRRAARFALALAAGLIIAGAPALAQDHDHAAAEAAGPHAYIINLEDGATVKSPVLVQFGLSGYGVAPAGVDKPDTGHHHLLIDTTEVKPGEPLPAIPGSVVHFGGGQTETTVELAPGRHTLMLVLGDLNHVPLEPSVQSTPITITVE